MTRSFIKGMLIGILAPLAFVAAVVYWIYRHTAKVPFPTRRTADGELVVGLVEPGEVQTLWQRWTEELAPAFQRLRELGERASASYRSTMGS